MSPSKDVTHIPSSSDEASTFKDLKPILDVKVITLNFTKAALHLARCILWVEGQEEWISTRVSQFNKTDPEFSITAPDGFNLEEFLRVLITNHNQCFFSITLPRYQLLFKTVFISQQKTALKFGFPTAIYQLQRRKKCRYRIPESYVLRIELCNPKDNQIILNEKAIDISTGGLSFETDAQNKLDFSPGLRLDGICFTIHRKKILVNATVQHVKTIKSVPGQKMRIRIGVTFNNLSQEHLKIIDEYVLDETTKNFAKYFY